MKNVQEWLRELDTERLVKEYLRIDPIRYDSHPAYLDRTVREIRNARTDRIRRYIERLRTMTVKAPEDGQQGLLYAHRVMKDGMDDQTFGLIYVDELLEKGCDAQEYAYEFMEQAEIVGFLVADTPLTLRYIYQLMADVLNEASFFGFEQEDLETEWKKLADAAKEVDSGTAEMVPWETVKKELEERTGQTFDEQTQDEKKLYYRAVHAEMAYSQHSREKELHAVIDLLQAERGS